jgi:hypothetical protein
MTDIDTSNLFVPVDPADLPARSGRRARTSAPILDAFIESGNFLAKLDPAVVAPDAEDEEADKRQKTLYSSLKSYALNNQYPVRVFQRAGVVHLQRMDIDADGNAVEWTPLEKPEPKAADNGADDVDVDSDVNDEYE